MILEKPSPPKDNECCDSACNPCVWDTYYEKRREWRLAQIKINELHPQKSDD